ncbi:hypothetical protein D3C76_1043390 [compost metagenome]
MLHLTFEFKAITRHRVDERFILPGIGAIVCNSTNGAEVWFDEAHAVWGKEFIGQFQYGHEIRSLLYRVSFLPHAGDVQ